MTSRISCADLALEALRNQLSVDKAEHFRLSQLERRVLEGHIPTGRVGEHEPADVRIQGSFAHGFSGLGFRDLCPRFFVVGRCIVSQAWQGFD